MSLEFKEPCPVKRAASAKRVREYRERNAKNPAHIDRARSHHLKSLYGVTLDDMARYLGEQGGKCKICRTDLCISTLGSKGRKGKPHVDHCHKTGKYRGILCHGCNLGIGLFQDNPAALANAIKYLGASQ